MTPQKPSIKVILYALRQGCSGFGKQSFINCQRFKRDSIVPRYLVEREIAHAAELTAVELQEIIQQSLRVQQGLKDGIQWLQATITTDRMLCLFIAENEEIIRDHARLSGLPISRICEVSAVIGPLIDGPEKNHPEV